MALFYRIIQVSYFEIYVSRMSTFSFNGERYTFIHLFQNRSVAARTAFSFFLKLIFCSWKMHRWQFEFHLQIKRWYGVISSRSLMPWLTIVRGRLFIILSNSVRNVDKTSTALIQKSSLILEIPNFCNALDGSCWAQTK